MRACRVLMVHACTSRPTSWTLQALCNAEQWEAVPKAAGEFACAAAPARAPSHSPYPALT